jgi:hypothetical protein
MGHAGRMALVGAAMAMFGGVDWVSAVARGRPMAARRAGDLPVTGAEMAAKRKAWAKAKPRPANASRKSKRRKGGG